MTAAAAPPQPAQAVPNPTDAGVSDANTEATTVSLDEFRRLDLRVGEIVDAEPVIGTTRLVRLEVDLGAEHRVIVAGLAQHYTSASLLGMKVIVLANLAPAQIRDVTSDGMLLGAQCDRAPMLLTIGRSAPNGARVS